SKKLIDLLQAFHSEQPALRVSDFTRSVKSLHYYDSILIIEKERRERPYPVRSGVPDISFSTPWDRNYIIKIKNVLVRNTNKILRSFRFSGFSWRCGESIPPFRNLRFPYHSQSHWSRDYGVWFATNSSTSENRSGGTKKQFRPPLSASLTIA